jgi:Tol biopolymer transport system component
MRRSAAAPARLAVAAALAVGCLTISAAPALAAGSQTVGRVGTGAPATSRVTASLPADGRIAFTDFTTNQMYTVSPDGTGLVQLTHEPAGIAARWANWSPDGSHILFVRFILSTGMGRIWIMNADGTGQHQLTSDAPGYRDYTPKYTPDGKRIVFTRCSPNDGLCAIWIMNADGTQRHLLVPFLTAPTETNNFDPAVSPDGRHISYERLGFRGIISQVWVADINGKHAHPLTAAGLEAAQAAWSPDGSHIAFASNCCRAQSSVYVVRANGTGLRRLATSKWPHNNFGPVYAPGGDQIAFSSDRRYPDVCCEDLFAMRADGAGQHLIATGKKGVIDIAWGSAPPVPAGSPDTIARPTAGVPLPGPSRAARCREALAWLTSTRCDRSSAAMTLGRPTP